LHLSLYIEIGFQHFHIFLKGFQSRGGNPTESAWLFALEGFRSPWRAICRRGVGYPLCAWQLSVQLCM